MEFKFTVAGDDHSVSLERGAKGLDVLVDGHRETVEAEFADNNTVSLFFGQRIVTVHIAFDGDKICASVDGEKFEFEKNRAVSSRTRVRGRAGPLEAETVISTPMPGQIVKIQVAEGDTVEAGQELFIVESMKMENQIRSSIRARVEKVHFRDGDPVDANAPIVELSPVEE